MARQKKKKKTTVYYTNRVFDAQQDVQQSLVRTVYMKDSHSPSQFLHPHKRDSWTQTNTEIIIFFFYSVCAPLTVENFKGGGGFALISTGSSSSSS